jgi:RNA polymerase sigma-70 factor (ECF subfamily)
VEDSEIVALYWQRDERAIAETDGKYGPFCRAMARNLLGSPEDAEECVSDTWLEAWNSMPEEKPDLLRPWLGRVLRLNAIDRWRKAHRQKRFGGVEDLALELEECVPACSDDPQRALEASELGQLVKCWLDGLGREDRRLFLRRYWNGEALNALAAEEGMNPALLAQRMHRLRLKLKGFLEKEGIVL